MARTLRNAMSIEEARGKIQTSQILNRLHKHIVSKVNVMSESQVRAALGLLRKVIPDLANVEIATTGNAPILIVTGVMREQVEQNQPVTIDMQPADMSSTPEPIVNPAPESTLSPAEHTPAIATPEREQASAQTQATVKPRALRHLSHNEQSEKS